MSPETGTSSNLPERPRATGDRPLASVPPGSPDIPDPNGLAGGFGKEPSRRTGDGRERPSPHDEEERSNRDQNNGADLAKSGFRSRGEYPDRAIPGLLRDESVAVRRGYAEYLADNPAGVKHLIRDVRHVLSSEEDSQTVARTLEATFHARLGQAGSELLPALAVMICSTPQAIREMALDVIPTLGTEARSLLPLCYALHQHGSIKALRGSLRQTMEDIEIGSFDRMARQSRRIEGQEKDARFQEVEATLEGIKKFHMLSPKEQDLLNCIFIFNDLIAVDVQIMSELQEHVHELSPSQRRSFTALLGRNLTIPDEHKGQRSLKRSTLMLFSDFGPDAAGASDLILRNAVEAAASIRPYAAVALARVAPEELGPAIPVLLASLTSESPKERELNFAACIGILPIVPKSISGPLVHGLAMHLKSKDEKTRLDAVEALASSHYYTGYIVNQLAPLALTDQSAEVRAMVAVGLGKLRGHLKSGDYAKAREALEYLREDPDERVAKAATLQLGKGGAANGPVH